MQWCGYALNAYGVFNTSYSIFKSGFTIEKGCDLYFGIVGFCGWQGSAISLSYSLGKEYGFSTWFTARQSQIQESLVLDYIKRKGL